MSELKPKFAALVTDVDRTLLDTEQFIFQAYSHTLSLHGHRAIVPADLNPLMGKSLEACYEFLAPSGSIEELTETHRGWQDNNLHLALPFPNTIKTLQTLTAEGLKIAAVTTRSRRSSEKTLELTGLMPYLATVVSKEDVAYEELKPHPKPIFVALERMKIDPTRTVMMGDAKEDIQAGKRAGTKTIGVTYGSVGEQIRKSHPDYVVDDIAGIIPIFLSV